MFLYCKSWDLEVNPVKSKITIFSNRKPSDVAKFMYNGQELDVDDSFVYLGTMFSYNGRFINQIIVIVLCFVVRYFISILVLQSS